MTAEDLTITRLGHRGDGIAEWPNGPVYVPFTLPGEKVRAEICGGRGRLVDIVKASPDRVEPICRHYGICGGCALQHMGGKATLDWKRDLVSKALTARGIEAPVEDVIPASPGSRRRTVFTVRNKGGRVVAGFQRRLSHDLIAVTECPILAERLRAFLSVLPSVAAGLLKNKGEARIAVTDCATGLHIAIEAKRVDAGLRLFERFAELGAKIDAACILLNGETIYETRTPLVHFGKAAVRLPPSAFLQASAQSEAAMAVLVAQGLESARPVLDLFAGMGAFALRLAEKTAVTAVEGDTASATALQQGFNTTPGLKPVTVVTRDLVRDPLTVAELNAFGGLVFDPPRAGAREQAHEIAASDLPVVVAVSCNPATFARDARILIDGGYRLDRVYPVDQFLYAPNVELVALFRRM